MSIERQQEIFEIADLALDLPADERQQLLDRRCGDDSSLRQAVEALLETDSGAGVLAEPAFDIHAVDAAIGRHIDHYTLVELLDRGGMGSVYLAEHDDFDKQVAVKLIRRGLDLDPMLVQRFHNERQILARLEHPHVAQLLDGGATDDGLPYFVMERVVGLPIDQYCEHHQLNVEGRLQLFQKVCSAVHFAHQNLVIHRDLKPANILITEEGEPKLLDFGIAKLLDDNLAAQPLRTALGQSPMTTRYASPEQIRLQPISTASDIFSLGVLLYELLTGVDPYRAETRRSDEVSRAICDEEPSRPSTAVKRSARIPPPRRRRLSRRLSGDLDSIVLKALRKEPGQRYRSAEDLSEDIDNHLDGRPVKARAGTFSYRATKFVRRNLVALAVVAGYVVVSTGAVVVSTIHSQQADRARQRAEDALEFLVDVFANASPDRIHSEPITVLRLLVLAEEELRRLDSRRDPEVRLRVAEALASIYRTLGEYDASRQLNDFALELALEIHHRDPQHQDIWKVKQNLAVLEADQERYEEAESKLREVLAWRRSFGQKDSRAWINESNLASVLLYRGKFGEAEDIFQRVLKSRLEARNPKPLRIAASHHNLGALNLHRGDLEKAQRHAKDALTSLGELAPEDDDRGLNASTLNLLGTVLAAQGQVERARELYEQAWEKQEVSELRYTRQAITKKNLANLLAASEPDYAYQLIDEALKLYDDAAINQQSWKMAEAQSIKGEVLAQQGPNEVAEPLLRTSFERLREVRGLETHVTQQALRRLIAFYEAAGQPEVASRYRSLEWGPSTDTALPPASVDE